ncbi:MAG TPA: mechanosensitive ion channel domain-containing protein [Candidatus Polarisedimenticolaceae bacterium]|nr:mechanosensitive ion channel domain-containing protein [Candidatus Polarisedimenticolaceae bacterium]
MRRVVLAVALLAGTAPAWAQGTPPASPVWSPAANRAPAPEAVPGSPRAAVFDFIAAARRADFATAAKYLDLSRLPDAERKEPGAVLARHLKIVIDRNLWIDFDKISDAPEGDLDDGLPTNAEKIGAIPAQGGTVNLILRREDDGTGAQVWRFSSAVVAKIPELYDQFGYGWIGDHVPARLQSARFFNIEAWQWIGLIVLAIVAWIMGRLFASGLARLGLKLAKKTSTPIDDRLADTMRRPARWAASLIIVSVGVRFLDLSVHSESRFDRVLAALTFITFVLVVQAIVEAFVLTARTRLLGEGQTSSAGVLTVMNRIAKVLLACVALIGVLRALGFNVTTLLAGLGVGGIAVALAAQKTLENLFGGLALMADKPVKIGDSCNFGNKTGIVEDIGLRSTRIRTPDRTVISVPNGEFSNAQIENLSNRDRMRFYTKLKLRYETTPDQLRAVLIDLRRLLVGHPKTFQDSEVRLAGFGESALEIEMQCTVATALTKEFGAIREDLLLRAMDILETNGTGLAVPSQVVYLGRDRGVDAEAKGAAEEKVRALREQNKLPFPDFTPQEIAEIADKLDYPASGSSPR